VDCLRMTGRIQLGESSTNPATVLLKTL